MSTLALRLSLSVIGFAAAFGIVYAIRHEPPDLTRHICPDCGNTPTQPIRYHIDAETGKVTSWNANIGLLDPDPSAAVPTPLRGPKFHCTHCGADYGPPDVLRHGHRPRR